MLKFAYLKLLPLSNYKSLGFHSLFLSALEPFYWTNPMFETVVVVSPEVVKAWNKAYNWTFVWYRQSPEWNVALIFKPTAAIIVLGSPRKSPFFRFPIILGVYNVCACVIALCSDMCIIQKLNYHCSWIDRIRYRQMYTMCFGNGYSQCSSRRENYENGWYPQSINYCPLRT